MTNSTVRTGYMWEERFAWHDTGTAGGIWPAGGYLQPHQAFESSESKARFAGLVEVSGLINHLHRIPSRLATDEELLTVHTKEYVENIREQSDARGGDAGDGASPFGPGSFEIAKQAIGGILECIDAIQRGEIDNAYALTRPPGHHAEPDWGRGYCLFSNVSIAVEHLRNKHGMKRIAIVDYDVHHGNGAQRIYWDDAGVLHISLHQDGLFPPDTGNLDEIGAGEGEGYNINVPLPAGSGNGAYLAAFEDVVVPALDAFQPEFILVSSGFDPSPLDPLGGMGVTSNGFRKFAEILNAQAKKLCDGKIVFCHEGGYSPVHVPFCGLAVIEEISGVRTDVEDPFRTSFDEYPAQKYLAHQKEVVDAASEMVKKYVGK